MFSVKAPVSTRGASVVAAAKAKKAAAPKRASAGPGLATSDARPHARSVALTPSLIRGRLPARLTLLPPSLPPLPPIPPLTAGEAGLWLPNTTRPDWLDGSLPGDRGFDPLGLSKPTEYLQYDVDSLDQNKAVNKAGGIVGAFSGGAGKVDSASSLQPYDDVFSLARFRENEVIHGRWAMLAALGVLVAEGATGVSWADATAVELEKASYLGLSLPFSATALAYINPILIGGAELYRNAETDPEKRCYPGGVFDPLGLASGDADQAFRLKEAELKHGRLAMLACLGFGVQQLAQGEGALGSLKKFADSF